MIINVGSRNIAKVDSVRQTIIDYPLFSGATIIDLDANSGVSSHPRTLEETMRGACNRARDVFRDCDYSIGFEGGLIEVPHTKTGHMEISACAIYDGKQFATGLSSGFEWPLQVTRMILEGMEGSDAMLKTGLTEHLRIGSTPGGAIGILTKDRVSRIDYSKQSLQMALIQLEFPEQY
ncbi:MAG: inosine/xanthosine triphosphatase [Candidatus Nanoarchaeia archaeon]